MRTYPSRSTFIGFSLLCITGLAAQAAVPVQSRASAQAPDATLQAVHDFVQGFYDWYVALVQHAARGNPIESALNDKRPLFSDAIVTALQADMDAQAKSPDDIVGIDFDPFLAAQDECWPYKVGRVKQTGGSYQAEVFGSCSNPHPEEPDVIVEVEKLNGTWVFVNFLYPGNTDLLSELRTLKEEREKNPN